MTVVRCKCGATHQVAGLVDDQALLSMVFSFVDVLSLALAGWSFTDGKWRCVHCTRRRRLIRLVHDADTETPEKKSDPENV